MERREFTKGLLSTVLSYSLMNSLISTESIGYKINPITKHWAIKLNSYCSDLKKIQFQLKNGEVILVNCIKNLN